MMTRETCLAALSNHPHISNPRAPEDRKSVYARLAHLIPQEDEGLSLEVLLVPEKQILVMEVRGFGQVIRTTSFFHLIAQLNNTLLAGNIGVDNDGEIRYRQHRFCNEGGEGAADPDAFILDRMIDEAYRASHILARELLMARLHEAEVPAKMREAMLESVDEFIEESSEAA